MPGMDVVAYIGSSTHELNCLHASSINESGIVYSVDVVFLLHSRPDNFVESHDCQQSQPIQKLHQGVKSFTPGTRQIEQLSQDCPSMPQQHGLCTDWQHVLHAHMAFTIHLAVQKSHMTLVQMNSPLDCHLFFAELADLAWSLSLEAALKHCMLPC